MTSSGTYQFDPSNGDFVVFAYSLCGLRRSELTTQHMADARTALNLLFSNWSNFTPNLWTVDLVSVELEEGVASYDVDPKTIMILDAYIRTGDLGDVTTLTDRIIWPISRTDYASMPNKNFLAPPTVFWFDRTREPTITLWQVPDFTSTVDTVNQLQYYRCTTIQDANVANGETADIPPRWAMATVFGLAELLAMSWATDRAPGLAVKAAKFLEDAMTQDVENVPLFIGPMIGSYYPR